MRTVTGTGLNISRGSYLCSEATVEIDTKWGGFKNLAGSEGGFLIHASGSGEVVVGCFGAIEKVTLAPGERLVLDTGHMVAYEPSVQMTLRKAATGLVQTLKSGEGFVFEFTGPGDIWTQTRSPSALVRWLTTACPSPAPDRARLDHRLGLVHRVRRLAAVLFSLSNPVSVLVCGTEALTRTLIRASLVAGR